MGVLSPVNHKGWHQGWSWRGRKCVNITTYTLRNETLSILIFFFVFVFLFCFDIYLLRTQSCLLALHHWRAEKKVSSWRNRHFCQYATSPYRSPGTKWQNIDCFKHTNPQINSNNSKLWTECYLCHAYQQGPRVFSFWVPCDVLSTAHRKLWANIHYHKSISTFRFFITHQKHLR